MSRKIKKTFTKTRDTPMLVWLINDDSGLDVAGYSKLADCPEVRIAVERIADLISNMTVHLMQNTDQGDRRIKNELSRKIDVNPYKKMTRQVWVHWIVKNLLINGNAFVLPIMKDGLIADLKPLRPKYLYPENEDSENYRINYLEPGKEEQYDAAELLHFLINPQINKPYWGESYKVALKDVIGNLRQANKTTKEFMSSKVMPSLIVKVDANTAEIASEEGREGVYSKYLKTAKAGDPWIIPAELLDVQAIKPLTLNDIALNDSVKLDKRTVAGIIGIPAFLLGVGEFSEAEYNNFVRTRIMTIAKGIEQVLTQGLLYSPELYFKFNSRSLYAYELQDMANVGSQLFVRGIMTGNEVRDWVGLTPLDGLNELTILENYIPLDKIGEQLKLGGGES